MKYLKYLLGIILLLVLIFFGKGLLTPTVNYQSEIVVNKSAKEAWAVMSDEVNLPKWINGYQKSELISGEPNTVGAVSNIYVVEQGVETVMEETITGIKVNEKMAMRFTMDFMNMDYVLLFKEDGDKTTLTSNSTAIGNGILAKSIISFMPKAMKAQEDENLNSLKALIDNNTKDYFPQLDEEQEVSPELIESSK